MNATVWRLPLQNVPQRFLIRLGTTSLRMACRWNTILAAWMIDLDDATSNQPLIRGLPLVTGSNLLSQFVHLELGGEMVVVSDGDPDQVPTLETLGQSGNLYYVQLTS